MKVVICCATKGYSLYLLFWQLRLVLEYKYKHIISVQTYILSSETRITMYIFAPDLRSCDSTLTQLLIEHNAKDLTWINYLLEMTEPLMYVGLILLWSLFLSQLKCIFVPSPMQLTYLQYRMHYIYNIPCLWKGDSENWNKLICWNNMGANLGQSCLEEILTVVWAIYLTNCVLWHLFLSYALTVKHTALLWMWQLELPLKFI